MSLSDEKMTNQQAIGRIMRLAVNCADKNWDAATGDGSITITADEAFALFLLVRFSGSHPTFVLDDGKAEKVCLASAAVEYIGICLEGRCPDCGRDFASGEAHEQSTCSNHCNEYPLPDDMPASNEPHPPKRDCH